MVDGFSEELSNAWKFINEGNEKKAFLIIDQLERMEDRTQKEVLETNILKATYTMISGNFEEALENVSDITNLIQELNLDEYLLDLIPIKLITIWNLGTFDEKILKDLSDIEKKLNVCIKPSSENFVRKEVYNLLGRGLVEYVFGDLDHSLKSLEKCIKNLKEFQKLSYLLPYTSLILGFVYDAKANISKAFESFNNVLTTIKGNNKLTRELKSMALYGIGNNFYRQNRFDEALDYFKQTYKIIEDNKENTQAIFVFWGLIDVLIQLNDLESAEFYMDCLEKAEYLKSGIFYNAVHDITRSKILVLRGRFQDYAEAQLLLREIIKNHDFYEILSTALIQLSRLTLQELQWTKKSEIIEEIRGIIDHLLEISQHANKYRILAETYLLQGRFALIQLKINDAKAYLTKAQKSADEKGFNRIGKQISLEYDILLEQSELWEQLKEKDVSISERFKLAEFRNLMERIQNNNPPENIQIETEQPISLLIMTKTGTILLSNPFTSDFYIDSSQIGKFFSAFRELSTKFFDGVIDRMRFLEYNVVLKNIDEFFICYIFEGYSYTAHQKLTQFSKEIENDSEILKELKIARDNNHIIEIDEKEKLNALISEIFLSDPEKLKIPFAAYEGNEPFIFVSYAHTDRIRVYPTINFLNKEGIHIWYDKGISISKDWRKTIVDNINRCHAFLVFLTPQIVDSEYVMKEINYALDKNKPFLAVYLKETQLPDELAFEISHIQSLRKFTMPETEFNEKLKEQLNTIINK